jgi:hypothetical protein
MNEAYDIRYRVVTEGKPMKVFLASVCAAVLLAGAANILLTHGVQESARAAFSATSARP